MKPFGRLNCALLNLCADVCLSVVEEEEEVGEAEEEVGGLFKVSRPNTGKRLRADATDCSRFEPDASHNWDQEEVGLCA